MTETIKLEASIRTQHGTSHAKRLRKTGVVPAIIYGKNNASTSITLPTNAVNKVMSKKAFHNQLIDLVIEKKNTKVILKDYQCHPGSGKLLHLDFQITSKDEKVTMSIPLRFTDIDSCPGVKTEGGVASHLINEVEVQCLPDNIPHQLEIDASQLKLNDVLHLSDFKLPKGVTFNHEITDDHDPTVLTIHLPKGVKADDDETPEQDEESVDTDESPENKS